MVEVLGGFRDLGLGLDGFFESAYRSIGGDL
jgi:hypothetical protein